MREDQRGSFETNVRLIGMWHARYDVRHRQSKKLGGPLPFPDSEDSLPGSEYTEVKNKIYVCGNHRAGGAGCVNRGKAVLDALMTQASEREDDIQIVKGTCLGHCSEGPNVKIHGGRIFNEVQVGDVAGILDALKPKRRRAR